MEDRNGIKTNRKSYDKIQRAYGCAVHRALGNGLGRGLSINAGAYIAETIRAGIQSVDVGQGEAASALGLSAWQSMRYVILPQALKSVVPALGNSFVSLIKDSSLASVIATPELMYWANAANAQYYRVWETFITTAVIYLFLTVVTSRILAKLEKNM